ncbi:MAG TPA: DUF599 domain-containing protein [Dongiaceae bacterium]
MISGLTWLDGVSLACFLFVLLSYGRLAVLIGGGRSLNALMHQVRRGWMQRMIDRPDRIVDAALTGHTVSSIAFFSSANILIVAGLFGLLGRSDDLYRVISAWPFVTSMSANLIQLKILGLIAILGYGFFRFTWALRQYNYCCALIGAAPLADDSHPHRREIADQVAIVFTSALRSFGAGIRCYYFAVAWITWLAGPTALLLATGIITVILLRRQMASHSARAIRRYIELNPPTET